VAEGTNELSYSEFVALIAGDTRLRTRLVDGERLRVQTPFLYPGRRGPIVVDLVPGSSEVSGSSEGPGSSGGPGSRPVRISDAGGLIKSLDEQGLDLAVDMIVSKTVFHAVKQVDGAGVSSGEVYLDSTTDTVPADFWRFLQMLVEIVGLRHSKYKDALVQLSRRQERAPDLIGWEEPN
jgi:hypothetical protein